MDEHENQTGQSEEVEDGARGSSALIPSQVSQIGFYGDALLVVLVEINEERQAVIPLRQFCDYLGVDWSGQRQRLLRDEELAEEVVSVAITSTQTGKRGYYNRPVLCLPLDLLPGWLFGVTPSRVKPEYRERVRLYRKKCYRALWEAFQRGELFPDEVAVVPSSAEVVLSVPQPTDLALIEAQYDHLLGVTNLVREHLEILTGVMTPVADKLDYAVRLLETLVGRQEAAETKIAQIDQRTQRLTPEHARTVAEFVEQMIHHTANAPVPLDHYKIYGRLKHRFRTNSYKEVADERFSEVMTYLREMLRQALGGELPQQGSLF
jgi:hypothetical protein